MSTFCGIVDCVENACYLNFCKDTLKLRAGCDKVNDSDALCVNIIMTLSIFLQ